MPPLQRAYFGVCFEWCQPHPIEQYRIEEDLTEVSKVTRIRMLDACRRDVPASSWQPLMQFHSLRSITALRTGDAVSSDALLATGMRPRLHEAWPLLRSVELKVAEETAGSQCHAVAQLPLLEHVRLRYSDLHNHLGEELDQETGKFIPIPPAPPSKFDLAALADCAHLRRLELIGHCHPVGWMQLLCAPTLRQSLEHLCLELMFRSSSPLLDWNAIFANLTQLHSLRLHCTFEFVSDDIIDALRLHGSAQLMVLSVLPYRNVDAATNGLAAMWPSCAAIQRLLWARKQLRLIVLITHVEDEAEKERVASGAANDPEQERQFRASLPYAALYEQFPQRVARVCKDD